MRQFLKVWSDATFASATLLRTESKSIGRFVKWQKVRSERSTTLRKSEFRWVKSLLFHWQLDAQPKMSPQGTEAESYLRKPISAKAVKTNKQAATSTPKPSAWRSKHEDFIKTIRAAKEMQQHLARGGKLSDLPPPPPSENPDYVTCPHCSRRFNEGVAARHIPACANMLHNKPKPKPANTGSKVTSFTKRR